MPRETPDELKFSVDVAVRYHDRRRGFFDFAHRVVAALSVFGGSAAAIGLIAFLQKWPVPGEWLILGSAITITLLNSFDLVVGFSARARAHDALYRRFVEFDAKMVKVGEPSEGVLREWLEENLLIERDEPSTFWGIYALCWNQAIIFMRRDRGEILEFAPWRVWFGLGHIIRWRERDFRPAPASAAD